MPKIVVVVIIIIIIIIKGIERLKKARE